MEIFLDLGPFNALFMLAGSTFNQNNPFKHVSHVSSVSPSHFLPVEQPSPFKSGSRLSKQRWPPAVPAALITASFFVVGFLCDLWLRQKGAFIFLKCSRGNIRTAPCGNEPSLNAVIAPHSQISITCTGSLSHYYIIHSKVLIGNITSLMKIPKEPSI